MNIFLKTSKFNLTFTFQLKLDKKGIMIEGDYGVFNICLLRGIKILELY